MNKKPINLLVFLGIAVFFASVAFVQVDGINLQAGLLRTFRKAALRMASVPPAATLLPVPFHKQEHSLSCEAAALKMALDFRGLNIAESEIIEKIGVDPTPRGNGVWGDPDEAFVGNIDGKMMKDGYGVHAPALARAALEYRPAVSFKFGKISDITSAIENGDPVIIWGHLLSGKEFYWRTPLGKEVKAVYGEHTKIVRGFSGSAENPTGFFLMDPIYGEVYESTADFLNEWRKLDFSGVIVY